MTAHSHGRAAGILVPVFSLRRDSDLGIGDTSALRELCGWAKSAGIGFIQLLPINETGPDISPYNAISSVALDPLLLEMSPSTVPALDPAALEAAKAESSSIADTGLVDYPRVRALKRKLLESAWANFNANPKHPGRPAYDAFRAGEADWLEDYCAFRFLMDLEGGRETWDTWSDSYNTADKARAFIAARLSEDTAATWAALGFHAFVQWVAFTQWKNLRRHAESRKVRLMGDIPIGVSYYSADVFFNPAQFDLDWCGGAPPETIFKDDPFVQKWGQNWGIPLYRWDTMALDGYKWWQRRIRKLIDVFHIFRIDHVLGFYRIYSFPWRPQHNAEFLPLDENEAAARTGGRLPHFKEHADDSPEHMAANRAAGDTYIGAIQAAAGGAEVVAEDLGMVPEYVRPHLLERGIPGFKIVHWETGADGRVIPGSAYPECSFTTICTHDHEPMKVLWDRLCAEARGERGDADDHWKSRRDLRLLCDFAAINAPNDHFPPYSDTVKWQLLASLLHSNSRYAAMMISDLFSLEERFNVPGTLDPRNWRTRLPWTVTELATCQDLSATTATLREFITASGRLPE